MSERIDVSEPHPGVPATYVQDAEKAHVMAIASDRMETKAVHHLEDAAEYVANLGKQVTDKEMDVELENAHGFGKYGLKLAANSRYPGGASDEKRLYAAEVSTSNFFASKNTADRQAEEAAKKYEKTDIH